MTTLETPTLLKTSIIFSQVMMLQHLLSKQLYRSFVTRPVSLTSFILKKDFVSLKILHLQKRSHTISTDGKKIEDLIDKISATKYCHVADSYLETLSDSLEELGEKFPQIDVELTQGVMSLTVAPGKTYVINKQPPNKQIWLSSPISGPKRFDLIGGKWITLRDNTSLTDLLRKELEEELACEVYLRVEN